MYTFWGSFASLFLGGISLEATMQDDSEETSSELLQKQKKIDKAFENIINQKLPEYVIKFILQGINNNLFKESKVATLYGRSKSYLSIKLAIFVLFLVLELGIGAPLLYKIWTTSWEPLLVIIASIETLLIFLVMVTLHSFIKTWKCYFFDGYAIITDNGILFIKQGEPKESSFIFYENMDWVTEVLVSINQLTHSEVVLALRFSDKVGSVQDLAYWREKEISEPIFAFIKKRVKEKKILS